MLDPKKFGHSHLLVLTCSLIFFVSLKDNASGAPAWHEDFADESADVSNNGVINPIWVYEGEDERIYVLEQADNPDFADAQERYRGSDQSSILTGFPEGEFYFRVRVDGPNESWSPVRKVTVKFIDRRILVALLIVGFIVVATIVITVIKGWSKERRRRS